MYLVDTSVWLERLLEQQRASEVRLFLEQTATDKLFVTDFALHSIGIILDRLQRLPVFLDVVKDLFPSNERQLQNS